MAKSARTIFQLGALVMLLIIFPAASWYYLNSGFQYRRSIMADLQEYGTFPVQTWDLVDGTRLSGQFLDKKMMLTHFMPDMDDEALTARYGEILQRLHDQFEEREELVFLTLLTDQSPQRVDRFAQQYELDDQPWQFFIRLDEAKADQLAKEVLQPKGETGVDDPAAFFALTDTTATIRRFYDVRQDEEIKRLVEHIALLLPFKKDRDLIFKRETEK